MAVIVIVIAPPRQDIYWKEHKQATTKITRDVTLHKLYNLAPLYGAVCCGGGADSSRCFLMTRST